MPFLLLSLDKITRLHFVYSMITWLINEMPCINVLPVVSILSPDCIYHSVDRGWWMVHSCCVHWGNFYPHIILGIKDKSITGRYWMFDFKSRINSSCKIESTNALKWTTQKWNAHKKCKWNLDKEKSKRQNSWLQLQILKDVFRLLNVVLKNNFK